MPDHTAHYVHVDNRMKNVNANLPVIRVFATNEAGCTYANIEVPGRSGLSVGMALRIAAEAIETLSNRRYDCRGPLIEQTSNTTIIRLAVFDVRTHMSCVLDELRRAAQREACIRTVRHSTGIITHEVKVQT